jgi:hypothetical protein
MDLFVVDEMWDNRPIIYRGSGILSVMLKICVSFTYKKSAKLR